MSFTVFLGNLPAWVTADDIKGWLSAENLVADAIKVIRNPETQESKGFAFIDAPNTEEMNSIIRRFDRAPLEDRLLRANPAQPPKPKAQTTGARPPYSPSSQHSGAPSGGSHTNAHARSQPTTAHTSVASPAASNVATQTATTVVSPAANPSASSTGQAASGAGAGDRAARRPKKSGGPRRESDGPQSAFAEELARAL